MEQRVVVVGAGQQEQPAKWAVFAVDDRCDRCNAAAKLCVRLAEGGELFFCGHHANDHAEALVKIAVELAVAPEFEWRGNELKAN